MWKYMLLVLVLSFFAIAAEKRTWDQEAAKKKVEHVIAVEKQGTPWNDIKWNTDVEKAVNLAQKEGKPIFLYIYVSEGGPSGTNC